MNQNKPKNLKLYHSIAEIADQLNVQQSTLRYWEKEFPQIKPKTNARGVRQYRNEDVEIITLIHHLLKEKGMTLQGARRRLEENREKAAQNFAIIQRLNKLKEELLEIRKELDRIPDAEEEKKPDSL